MEIPLRRISGNRLYRRRYYQRNVAVKKPFHRSVLWIVREIHCMENRHCPDTVLSGRERGETFCSRIRNADCGRMPPCFSSEFCNGYWSMPMPAMSMDWRLPPSVRTGTSLLSSCNAALSVFRRCQGLDDIPKLSHACLYRFTAYRELADDKSTYARMVQKMVEEWNRNSLIMDDVA